MNLEPKLVLGESGDQFPTDPADALLYFTTDGRLFLRLRGNWQKLDTASQGAVTSQQRWLLMAGVPSNIPYKNNYLYMPSIAWSCYEQGNPNNHVTPRFTSLTLSGMTVLSDVNAWFSFRAEPNMRRETQNLETPYTE